MAAKRAALAGAVMGALALLAGCGRAEPHAMLSAGSASVASTTAPAPGAVAATTTVPGDAMKRALLLALLKEADVPGSTLLEERSGGSSETIKNPASCAPFAAASGENDPNEVESPDLELVMGNTTHRYSSMATTGTPDELAQAVHAFSSDAGATCFLELIKSALGSGGLNTAGLQSTSEPVSIAGGGGIVRIRGSVAAFGKDIPLGAEMVAFRRGSTLVVVSALSFEGNSVKGVVEALALKIADRLP